MPPHGGPRLRCLEKWTLSGDALLVGQPPANVKLAAFYTCCRDFYYASQREPECLPAELVSNVAPLGSDGGEFRLVIDASSLSPWPGCYIYLILWGDANDNDAYDPGEEWRYVIPLYEDRVFLDATDCIYYYDDRENPETGTAPGWNQSVGLDRYVPILQPYREGASLSNESAWSTRAE